MSDFQMVLLALLALVAYFMYSIAARIAVVGVTLMNMDRRLLYVTMGISRNWPSASDPTDTPIAQSVGRDFALERERRARGAALV